MYCAYVTRIHNLRKHTNADRLLCGECFGNTVIVDLGTDPDQLGVYFPTDGKLGLEFAQKNDLLRRKDENGAPAGGYIGIDNGVCDKKKSPYYGMPWAQVAQIRLEAIDHEPADEPERHRPLGEGTTEGVCTPSGVSA